MIISFLQCLIIVNVKLLDYYDMLVGIGNGDSETGAWTYLMQTGMTEGKIREPVHFLTGD